MHWRSTWTVLVLAVFSASSTSAQNPPVNAELVGTWDQFAGSYGDVWADGDYAYIGHFGHHGVSIVDISDPLTPEFVAQYLLPPPNDNASAQDVKVANGLLFIAIESGSQSVHVVDVREPANPQPVVTIDIDGFRSIHNTFYYSGFLYIADSNSTRVGIIDLTQLDPDNPPANPITETQWMLENVGSSFVHDVTVQHNRLYAAAWDSGLWIYDVSNVAAARPSFLGQTPDGGNNTHSCWATDAGDYVVTGEERPGGGIKVYRITDNGNSLTLELTDSLALPETEASSVHNQTIIGKRLYNSWYGAGLQVFDIDSQSGLLSFVASYDTSGAWGVYPFLGPSRVLVSDIPAGLFIIDVDPNSGDLNGDGSIAIDDLLALLAAWGSCVNCDLCPADLDDSCDVAINDLLILLANWT